MEVTAPRFGHDDVEIISRDKAYSGFFELHTLRLKHRLFQGGWSAELQRELFVRDDAVCVLLYDPEQDAVVMIEQFRIGSLVDEQSPWQVELIAGIVEPGESDTDVANREAVEEAGAEVTELVPVFRYHVSPGGSQEQISLFCGKVDSRGLGGYHGLEHEGEDIRVMVLPRTQAYAALTRGRINNAHTMLALQWLELNWQQLQSNWCKSSQP